MKCQTCNKEYTPKCDYRQGRCPHHPPLIDKSFIDMIKHKLYNLFRGKQ